jgi:hypothetical protein
VVCADDVNVVGENTDTIKKNTEALLDANKQVGLEVNPGKTKYKLMSPYQKARRQQSMKIAKKSFEDGNSTNRSNLYSRRKSRLNSRLLATIRFRVFCVAT